MYKIKKYNELNERIGAPWTDIRLTTNKEDKIVERIITLIKEKFNKNKLKKRESDSNFDYYIEYIYELVIENKNKIFLDDVDPYKEDDWGDIKDKTINIKIKKDTEPSLGTNKYSLQINHVEIKSSRVLLKRLWKMLHNTTKMERKVLEREKEQYEKIKKEKERIKDENVEKERIKKLREIENDIK